MTWDNLLSGFIGALVVFLLALEKELWRRRKKHDAFWHALNAELRYASGKAALLFFDTVSAPLYRLPTMAFENCFPQLLSDGAITEEESIALMNFFNEVETLNRGLDRAGDASDPNERTQEYSPTA